MPDLRATIVGSAGLGEIDQVVGQGAVGPAVPSERPARKREQIERALRSNERQDGASQCSQPLCSTYLRFLAFGEIGFVDQITVPAADRNAHDVETLPFQRQDLAPDEAVADFRILIDQIGNAHGLYLYSIR